MWELVLSTCFNFLWEKEWGLQCILLPHPPLCLSFPLPWGRKTASPGAGFCNLLRLLVTSLWCVFPVGKGNNDCSCRDTVTIISLFLLFFPEKSLPSKPYLVGSPCFFPEKSVVPLPKETGLPQKLPQVILAHVHTEMSLKMWGCCGFMPCNPCHLSLRGDVPCSVKVLEQCWCFSCW